MQGFGRVSLLVNLAPRAQTLFSLALSLRPSGPVCLGAQSLTRRRADPSIQAVMDIATALRRVFIVAALPVRCWALLDAWGT